MGALGPAGAAGGWGLGISRSASRVFIFRRCWNFVNVSTMIGTVGTIGTTKGRILIIKITIHLALDVY